MPGAGLGRLAFDLASLGYGAQGTEFSYFMLLSSNFILNESQKKNEFTIFPYLHSFCNNFKNSDSF